MRYVAAAEEELHVGENGVETWNFQISPDIVPRMGRIQQDILRAVGAVKKGSETRP